MADLKASCESSVGEDGFGSATIDQPTVISGQVGSITVPCRIHLAAGGALTLDTVTLTTRHLTITDDASNGPSQVVVTKTELVGLPSSGFDITLSDASDSVDITGSALEYPLGIWLRIFGEGAGAPGGGTLTVSDSSLLSVDTSSAGIVMVASEEGGVGRFTNLVLQTPGDAVLFAGDCQASLIVGGPTECSPPP